MDVFGGSTGEIRPLKAPGICFLCEATPVQETDLVVNTMRIFSPGPMTNLNGTKYVCGSCSSDLGRAVGLVDPTDYAEVLEANANYVGTIKSLNSQVQAYSSLKDAVNTLATAPALAPDPVVADVSVVDAPVIAPAEAATA